MARPPPDEHDDDRDGAHDGYRGAAGPAPEIAEARLRARKALKLVIRCYLFGAAVTLAVLLLTADRDLGQLVLDTLFWPRTLGGIATTL